MKVIFTKNQVLTGSVWLKGSTSPELDEPVAQDLIEKGQAKAIATAEVVEKPVEKKSKEK